MRNLANIKQHLKKAYSEVPSDFNLQEIRHSINIVLQKIEQYEIKSTKRENLQKEEEKKLYEKRQQYNPLVFNPFATKETINAIDNMIKEEEKKIMDIKNKDKTPGNDAQALLG